MTIQEIYDYAQANGYLGRQLCLVNNHGGIQAIEVDDMDAHIDGCIVLELVD